MKRRLFKLLILLLVMKTSQVGVSGAYFSDQGKVNGGTLSTACWVAPRSPILLSPVDNDLSNITNVVFSWQSTTSSCPIASMTYKVEIFSDSNMAHLYRASDWTATTSYVLTNVEEGQYWWRVLVKDQYNNAGNSQVYRLVVDRTPPTVSLAITGSWTKTIEEKIGNGSFEEGTLDGWLTTGHVFVLQSDNITSPAATTNLLPYEGNYMARIGGLNDPGNWTWENRLMKSFDAGAKSISLFYNFFSRDYTPYDDPGFFIRLNGQEIFQQNTLSVNPADIQDEMARNSGWQQFVYDLSGFDNQKINLGLYAGNTGDKTKQSWVYVDRITTYFVSAPASAVYTLSGSDNGSGISRFEYKIDDGDWQAGGNFGLPTGGAHRLQYRSWDNAGNSSPVNLVQVITDTTSPSVIPDLSASTTENTAILSWTAPGNDGSSGRASVYDLRYQKSCSDPLTFNFDAATKVEKISAPRESGQAETREIYGLDSNTSYCFGIKSADEAPNWSGLSNIVMVNTLPSAVVVNYGDVIVNELMWMGSGTSPNDGWIELRNATSRSIDLSGWKLTNDTGAGEIEVFSFPAGASLPAGGYIVIAEYDKDHSSLKNNPDFIAGDGATDEPDFALSRDHLDLKLYSSANDVIDVAWDGTAPAEGFYNEVAGQYYSMERVSNPSNGTNPLEWYTSIDEASKNEFFDGVFDERGTPGAPNRSENEPLAHARLIPRGKIVEEAKSKEATPAATFTLSEDKHKVSLRVTNISGYKELAYELIYEADTVLQAVAGVVGLGSENEFVKDGIILGTCSAGGTCVYHENVGNIHLKVNLKDREDTVLSLEIR